VTRSPRKNESILPSPLTTQDLVTSMTHKNWLEKKDLIRTNGSGMLRKLSFFFSNPNMQPKLDTVIAEAGSR